MHAYRWVARQGGGAPRWEPSPGVAAFIEAIEGGLSFTRAREFGLDNAGGEAANWAALLTLPELGRASQDVLHERGGRSPPELQFFYDTFSQFTAIGYSDVEAQITTVEWHRTIHTEALEGEGEGMWWWWSDLT